MVAVAFVFALVPCAFAGGDAAFRWQLQKGARYTYDYNEEMVTTVDSGKTRVVKISVNSDGPLTINNNGKDAMALLDVKSKVVVSRPDMPEKELEAPLKVTEIPFDTSGNIIGSRYKPEANFQFFELLFPLPPDANPGSSRDVILVSRSAGMPDFTGKVSYAVVGPRVFAGIDCVAYHVVFNLKAARPAGKRTETSPRTDGELAGEYDCLFSPDRGFFISADGNMTIKVRSDIPGKGGEPSSTGYVVQYKKHSLRWKSAEYVYPVGGDATAEAKDK
jgi:hypothetical protein